MRTRPALVSFPILLLLAMQFLNGMVTSPSITFFPVFVSGIGFSAVFLSLVVMLQRITGMVSSLAGGIVSSTRGRKGAILMGQVLFFAAAVVFLGRTPWSMALFWGAAGLGMGLYSLGSQRAFVDLANPRSLGILTALYLLAYTAGATAGNPAAGFVLGRFGYREMALSLLSLGAVTVAATALFLPRVGFSTRPAVGVRGFFGYAGVLRRPSVLLLGVIRMLPTYGYGMLLVFAPLLLSDAGASSAQIALFASVSNICAAAAQLAIGNASDRMSPRWPALASFLAMSVSAAFLGLFPRSLTGIFVCGTIGVSAAWCLSTLVIPMVEMTAGASERGRVLGAIGLFWNVSMIVSALTGGFLYEAARGLPFLVSAGLGLPAIALTLMFFRRVPRRPGAAEVALAAPDGVAYKDGDRR